MSKIQATAAQFCLNGGETIGGRPSRSRIELRKDWVALYQKRRPVSLVDAGENASVSCDWA
jgi:hypothetical protein